VVRRRGVSARVAAAGGGEILVEKEKRKSSSKYPLLLLLLPDDFERPALRRGRRRGACVRCSKGATGRATAARDGKGSSHILDERREEERRFIGKITVSFDRWHSTHDCAEGTAAVSPDEQETGWPREGAVRRSTLEEPRSLWKLHIVGDKIARYALFGLRRAETALETLSGRSRF